ncbi:MULTISPECIES: protein-disulfide reductase DsbD [Methylomicrobium]|uniref:Thiol:disulfide interchange protein DsbD n=1 Tax=Methylomicrobium album BG8 TaxID=686340 RepID=H8GJX4_METAL|nr:MULTISPECIES: protein-disulfide reductase DsbD [Methylomicrobium]EIC27933.1 thiol:disulfide interchange protein [Methylomicrobium album BG8]
MRLYRLIFFCLLTVQNAAFALNGEDLLPPDQAFKVSALALSRGQLEFSWNIAEGFSLYRKNLRFESRTEGVELGTPRLPEGKTLHDEVLGDTVHYRNKLTVPVPVKAGDAIRSVSVLARYQGCSDEGVCYPPQKKTLDIALPVVAAAVSANPLQNLVKGIAGLASSAQEDLLPPDQAFQFSAAVGDPNTLQVNWRIAPGYYMYRDKTKLELIEAGGTALDIYEMPRGEPKDDPEFGQVEVFHDELSFDLPLRRGGQAAQTVTLKASYQGCAERGVCYPPMSKTVRLDLPVAQRMAAATAKPQAPVSEQDRIVQLLKHDSLGMTLASFFGFGLLLSFTPCIFPMIPILSGIIVGHRAITTLRAFLLSLSYVVASALTYTLFGVLAALFGGNLQTTFQQPWIIAVFSAVFVLLSLSMFGFYHLELPKSWQAGLHNSSERHRDGSLWGAAIMGSLSSLIVGPCVAAPLAAALIYIGQTGDAVLGGSALFAMGMGMGAPLLLVGASAGKLLPKAGGWLNATKGVFGVIMLAMAVWMLSRILPPAVSMLLWAMLLIIPSIYLSAIDPLPEHSSGWRKLWKGVGLIMLAYGLLLLIGVSGGATNPLKPLQGVLISGASAGARQEGIVFRRVANLRELEQRIEEASAQGRYVMLDFYADWCISCKEMEAYTFTDPKVKQALADFVLLQADVTENSEQDQALLAKFKLIGPPAILFFGPDRQERAAQRVIGYQDSSTFIETLQRIKP